MIEPDLSVSSYASDVNYRDYFDSLLKKNPWKQIQAVSGMMHILKSYESKELNQIDERLIRGLYMRSSCPQFDEV